MEKTPDQ